ncbi:ATP phosphoribosyltransferase regulatory subunit [Pontixanthobacter aestiaquae]|uniref:ATP phosphoribosyltransferase regulatory subunit n=1 Tax=Pontixanthobacter aestiaquae TaxID=1509367 RepID=A0A844Z7X5_9SPHN|nr:ATP phosphoribosyltransferase regulatory subunit [Pontixanthobacter aestiaquae]MDN3645984.1 ATP phosphoribosyltransferase regulatory subunit [Pontixanthobacter aestiaquae]MXO83023.1 ATP phosphoribosyltransferase regulatory subunit [Pontixanthobacter aestiaquae]
MTTNTDDLLPVGLSDRLPREAAIATHAMRAVLGAMDSHGYDRVRPPLVEFEKSMAERMDGIQPRKMFRFVDPVSLRTMALRSDMTVQVGRIAATSLAGAARPLRLCYAGEVATITSDQLDPARQRLQLGAELIGNDSVAAAGELVALAIEALEAAGATGISVDFTLPDLVDVLAVKAMPLNDSQMAAVRRELDTKDAGGLKQAGGESYLPLLYATGDFEKAIEQLAAIDAGGALTSRIDGLKAIAARVSDKARITLDPTERHGFEYQSWFGFTIYAEGVRGALGRGGTYTICGSDEAATGFSLYIDRLIDALDEGGERHTLFLPFGHDTVAATKLRAEGWRTVAALGETDGDPVAIGCTHTLDGVEPTKLG